MVRVPARRPPRNTRRRSRPCSSRLAAPPSPPTTGTRCSSWSACNRAIATARVDEDYTEESGNAEHSVRHPEPMFWSSAQLSRMWMAPRCGAPTALAGMAFQRRAGGAQDSRGSSAGSRASCHCVLRITWSSSGCVVAGVESGG